MKMPDYFKIIKQKINKEDRSLSLEICFDQETWYEEMVEEILEEFSIVEAPTILIALIKRNNKK